MLGSVFKALATGATGSAAEATAKPTLAARIRKRRPGIAPRFVGLVVSSRFFG